MRARRTSATRDAGGARDRVGDDALERALAELAVEECAEEALLGLGRTREELGEPRDGAPPAIRSRSQPRSRRSAASTSRSSSDGGCRPAAGASRSAAQPTPIGPCGRAPER